MAVPLPAYRCPTCHQYKPGANRLPPVPKVRAAFAMIRRYLKAGWWSAAGVKKRLRPLERVFFTNDPIDTNEAYVLADAVTEGILSTMSSCKREHYEAVDLIRSLFGPHASAARKRMYPPRDAEPWAVEQVTARIKRFRRNARRKR